MQPDQRNLPRDAETSIWKAAFTPLRLWARTVKRDVATIWLAARDGRVPWYAKLLAAAVAAYALSPIDLIPDFIPVIGYLDDIVILPLGILLVLRLIPPDVRTELRARVDADMRAMPKNRHAAAVIVAIWLLAGTTAVYQLWHHFAA